MVAKQTTLHLVRDCVELGAVDVPNRDVERPQAQLIIAARDPAPEGRIAEDAWLPWGGDEQEEDSWDQWKAIAKCNVPLLQ